MITGASGDFCDYLNFITNQFGKISALRLSESCSPSIWKTLLPSGRKLSCKLMLKIQNMKGLEKVKKNVKYHAN